MIKVLNIMLGKGVGGIEQVFLDYDYALRVQNENVVSVIHPHAKIRHELKSGYWLLKAMNKLDIFAAMKLRKYIFKNEIELIITHGNRAAQISQLACRGVVPIISVAHNEKFKPLLKSDAIITITEHLKKQIIKAKYLAQKAYKLHNPIILEYYKGKSFNGFQKVPVIGFIGRFVEKKGISFLVEALKQLDNSGLEFKAYFAGDGEKFTEIKKLITKLGLDSKINLLGWVKNKELFFNKIDLLVVPSLEEPFGLVVLEGFAFKRPIIATNTEGPSEIITDRQNGILIEKGSSNAIITAIKYLIDNPDEAKNIAYNGSHEANKYDILIFSRALQRILEVVKFDKIIGR